MKGHQPEYSSHSLDNGIRQAAVEIALNEVETVGTIDIAQLLMGKCREIYRLLYIVYLDQEKTFTMCQTNWTATTLHYRNPKGKVQDWQIYHNHFV